MNARPNANALLEQPERWPLALVLPLTHRELVDDWGTPVCGFLALGEGPCVFLGNVLDLKLGEPLSPQLRDLEALRYPSITAVADVWRVD